MKLKKRILNCLMITVLIICSFNICAFAGEEPQVIETPDISYTTHIQNIGWQNYMSNGELGGTTGQSLRLEGIRIKLEMHPMKGTLNTELIFRI